MVIIMKPDAGDDDIRNLKYLLIKKGFKIDKIIDNNNKMIYLEVNQKELLYDDLMMMPGVQKCILLEKRNRLVDRKKDGKTLEVKVGDQIIGGKKIVMMAGPCAVENEEQIMNIAEYVKENGATFLRGGAYKPRTSPYTFQGLKTKGLKLLRKAADKYDLKVISEVTAERYIDECLQYCDMLQIGARNMQNFELLKAVGRTNKAVLLKRAPCARIEEWLYAAEYIMSQGNQNVVLCERGIRTFETSTRNTLDISAIPVVKSRSSLPIIIDPSHACGKSEFVTSLSMAALAAGADGLLIETHNDPESAISDQRQQVTPLQYKNLFLRASKLSKSIGREI